MKKLVLVVSGILIGLVLLSVSQVSVADDFDIVGSWTGTLTVPDGSGTTLQIVFHVTKAEDGTLSSTMDSPDQNAFGIPMDTTNFEDNVLKIEIEAIMGAYEGTLNEETGTFDGTWSQGGGSLELDLVREEG